MIGSRERKSFFFVSSPNIKGREGGGVGKGGEELLSAGHHGRAHSQFQKEVLRHHSKLGLLGMMTTEKGGKGKHFPLQLHEEKKLPPVPGEQEKRMLHDDPRKKNTAGGDKKGGG